MKLAKEYLGGILRGRRGSSSAEYALILAIISTGIAGAAILLGLNISAAVSEASACIENANNLTPC